MGRIRCHSKRSKTRKNNSEYFLYQFKNIKRNYFRKKNHKYSSSSIDYFNKLAMLEKLNSFINLFI